MKTRISKRILSLLLTLCLLLCSFAPSVLTVNAATAVKVEYMGDYVCADFSNSRLFALKGTKLYLNSHCLQNKQSVKFSINSAFFIEMCYNKCKKIIKSNKKACT